MYPQRITYSVRKGDNLYQIAKYYQTTVPVLLSQNPGIDPYNLQPGAAITVSPGEKLVTYSAVSVNPDAQKQIALTDKMRLAWSRHVYWTRMLLISIAERLNDQSAVTGRLLQNPSDIAGVFASFYSDDTAKKIAQLLTEHLQNGAELITALRDGKTAEADTLTRRWYMNADKMADAFSGINPYYSREALKEMLYKHLELTTQEVAMRLSGNYPADIKMFDKVEEEALSMADYFTTGLMRQFPQNFY